MRVVVAYNDDVDRKQHLNLVERAGEADVATAAHEIAALLGGSLLAVRDVATALETLCGNPPDVVFNLCEGVGGNPRWEMHFALALEMLGIPFTGTDPVAAGICNDKGLTKRILGAAGIPVPAGYVVRDPGAEGFESAAGRAFALQIVKPVYEDAGIGVEPAAICRTRDDVMRRVKHVITTYRQPALVEEFIDGRELSQALYHGPAGEVVLPPGEIVFAADLLPNERVVGWRAKWAEGSKEDRSTMSRTPAVIDDTLRSDVSDVCRRAASILSLRGYCRFDLRQRPDGEPCIIDVNPNPDIGPGSGFRKALDAAAIPFSRFLDELMMDALSRNRP